MIAGSRARSARGKTASESTRWPPTQTVAPSRWSATSRRYVIRPSSSTSPYEGPGRSSASAGCRSQPRRGCPETFRLLLGLSNPSRQRRQQGLSEPGNVLEKDGEVPAADDEQAHRRVRDDRRRPRPPIQQAHLAEDLAGVQGHVLLGGHVDSRGPVYDQEEFVPGLAGPGQNGVSRDVEDPGDLGDTPELSLAAPLEERDFLESFNLVVLLGP